MSTIGSRCAPRGSPTTRSGGDVASVLITGGAGYIGSHAARVLTRTGRDVILYDNLSAGHREAALGAPLIEADIRDVEALRAAFRRHQVKAVMHFAALASVGDSVRDPAPYYRHNVEGTLSVLEAMASESVAQFVFSSTAAVFGEPTSVPITEAHPTRPINAYGETKLAVERALPHFERAYGIRWVSLRYFNAAGGGSGRPTRRGPPARAPSDPARPQGGSGRRAAAGVWRRLPDGRRDVPARLRPR